MYGTGIIPLIIFALSLVFLVIIEICVKSFKDKVLKLAFQNFPHNSITPFIIISILYYFLYDIMWIFHLTHEIPAVIWVIINTILMITLYCMYSRFIKKKISFVLFIFIASILFGIPTVSLAFSYWEEDFICMALANWLIGCVASCFSFAYIILIRIRYNQEITPDDNEDLPISIDSVNGCPDFYDLKFGMTVSEASECIPIRHRTIHGIKGKTESKIAFDKRVSVPIFSCMTDNVFINFKNLELDQVIITFSKKNTDFDKLLVCYKKRYGEPTEDNSGIVIWRGEKIAITLEDMESQDGSQILRATYARTEEG